MSGTVEVLDGRGMHTLMAELFPICRSITGDGFRETLRRLGERIPITVHEVPSGTPVLDWTVPDEWNIRDAWVADASGRRVIDFHDSNLHVVSYSVPIHTRMSLADLRPHLHTLPDHPDWIPYRTSYYHEDWGFCLRHRTLEQMPEGEYEVCIDATRAPGHLSYGECLLVGESQDEVLLSVHSCHPSLANDNLSGIALAVALVQHLRQQPRHFTYRVLFIPGTIGSITWLARNEAVTDRIRHGLVLSCVGDRGAPTYKLSRRGDAPIDRAVRHVLSGTGEHHIEPFVPYGYDERQYCSPGFNLPVGCFMRTPNGRFPEYHTSADDLDFVTPEALADSFVLVSRILDVVDGDGVYQNLSPKGEPQLGRRGLYGRVGGVGIPDYELALLWVLNLSDGAHSILDIAERSGLEFSLVRRAADDLIAHELLAPVTP